MDANRDYSRQLSEDGGQSGLASMIIEKLALSGK
jgi:hypothetical protein